MRAKIRKKINRAIFQERTKLLGGKQKAEKLYLDAANTRVQNGLCLCADEIRIYANNAEADADKSPATICETCGKPKLRVALTVPGGEDAVRQLRGGPASMAFLMPDILK